MLIKISSDIVIQFRIFEQKTCISDLNEGYCGRCFANDIESPKNAAVEIINAFKDSWTPSFFISLRDEINKKLDEHNKLFNTNF